MRAARDYNSAGLLRVAFPESHEDLALSRTFKSGAHDRLYVTA